MASQPPLLRLPREIRDQIIGYLFENFDGDLISIGNSNAFSEKIISPPFDCLPSICHTSMQLYHETTSDFLRRITLVLWDVETISYARKWLATFPFEYGFGAVQRLKFCYFHGPEQIKGYELIDLCPNLRELNVKFTDESAHVESSSASFNFEIRSNSWYDAHGSINGLARRYELQRIFRIPKLEWFHFGFFDWEPQLSHDRSQQLLQWLHIGFQNNGKFVYVECGQLHGKDSEEDMSIYLINM